MRKIINYNKEDILDYYRSGKSASEIAVSLKVTYSEIYNIIRPIARKRGGLDVIEGTKKCSACKQVFPTNNFDTAKTVNGFRPDCKLCRAKREKETRIRYNTKSDSEKRAILEKNRAVKLKYPEKLLHRYAKLRAKKKNIPFDIEISDIIIPTHCPILGIPLAFSRKALGSGSPTLDRIIPILGYTKGNIQVLSWKANKLKSNGTIDELELIVNYLKELQCQNTTIKENPSIHLKKF